MDPTFLAPPSAETAAAPPHAARKKTVADSWVFRRRDLLGLVCLVPLAGALLFSRPWAAPGTLLGLATDRLGWVLLASYAAFRIWATLFAGGRKDRVLQTRGPYSVTRNPLYLGSFCLALAGAAFLQSLTLLAGLAVLCLVYRKGVLAVEERMLLELFPAAYPAYFRRTPCFLPRLGLYDGPPKVEVNLAALRRETRRLAGALALPLVAGFAQYLRAAAWWPHPFFLP